MSASGLEVYQAVGDADWKIVSCTLEKAAAGHCVLVGDDTDLLVMLLNHVNDSHRPVFMKTSGKVGKTLCVTDKIGLLEWCRFCGSVARSGPGRRLTSRPLPARAAIIAEAIYGLLCVWDWVEGPQPAAAAAVPSCRLQSPLLARSLARSPPSWRRAGTLV